MFAVVVSFFAAARVLSCRQRMRDYLQITILMLFLICITKYVLGDEYRRDCGEFGCITEVLVFDCNLYLEPPAKSLHVCNMSISQHG